MSQSWVLWIGLGHRIATCVQVPDAWLAGYRKRVVGEWRGKVLGVYRPRASLDSSNHQWSEK